MKEEIEGRSEGKQSKNERIEYFLREHYNFRFNTVKSRTEFRRSNKDEPFYPLGKFDINSMRRLLDSSQGISTSAENIRAILEMISARVSILYRSISKNYRSGTRERIRRLFTWLCA